MEMYRDPFRCIGALHSPGSSNKYPGGISTLGSQTRRRPTRVTLPGAAPRPTIAQLLRWLLACTCTSQATHLVSRQRHGQAHQRPADSSRHVKLALHVDQGVVHSPRREAEEVQVHDHEGGPASRGASHRGFRSEQDSHPSRSTRGRPKSARLRPQGQETTYTRALPERTTSHGPSVGHGNMNPKIASTNDPAGLRRTHQDIIPLPCAGSKLSSAPELGFRTSSVWCTRCVVCSRTWGGEWLWRPCANP